MNVKSLVATLALLAAAFLVGCSAEEPSGVHAPNSPTGTGSPESATGAGSGVNTTR